MSDTQVDRDLLLSGMKYIFDFDDVLFHTTPDFKEYFYSLFEKRGISRQQLSEYFEKERFNLFSLKKMLAHFSLKNDLYREVMNQSKKFVNQEVLKLVKKLGKDNSYIVSYGDEEFQLDKIKFSGVGEMFSGVYIVQGSKKEKIEEICTLYRSELVFFIDDSASNFRHFLDPNYSKCPNLKTILYTDQSALELEKEFTNTSL